MALQRLDYEETAEPWILPDTPLILRRFLKVEGQDEIMIDVLLASDDEHLRIIEDAIPAESEIGPVPIATRRDIIWMKRSRNSDQDRVDIKELEKMTKVEKAVKIVSDLYNFYRKIPRISNHQSVRDEEHNQALQRTASERVLQPSGNPSVRRR